MMFLFFDYDLHGDPKNRLHVGHFYFCNIFGFCWLFKTIFTRLQWEMISVHIWNNMYHLILAVFHTAV